MFYLVNYRCCGAETTFDLGYMAWEGINHLISQLTNLTERIFLGNEVLHPYYAVPDSCCIRPQEGCGRDIFKGHSLKKMAEYVKVIDCMLSPTGCSIVKMSKINCFIIE